MGRDEFGQYAHVRYPKALSKGRGCCAGPFAALSAERDTVIVPAPPAVLIYRGVAYQSVTPPDGRRSITAIVLPGDIAGAGYALLGL